MLQGEGQRHLDLADRLLDDQRPVPGVEPVDLVLLAELLEPWMVVVGPALCVLSFATAYWVVNRFNTELLAEESPEPHDVR